MAAPVLSSISPDSGPPGVGITLTGSGFAEDSQVACPVLVATTYVTPTSLTATIPEGLTGAAGTSLLIGVYVRNADGLCSAALTFTVLFPAEGLQTWTTVEAVCGEIPAFARGGRIKDAQIETWMRSVAQQIAGVMMRRGLSTRAADWAAAGTDATPAAVGVLEMLNRLGAAARLAAAIASEFSAGESGLAKNLEGSFRREIDALARGDYDKLFRPAAATVESGPALAAGDMTNDDGDVERAFTKGKVF